MLRDLYGIEPGEIDLCTFPLFALFAPALGMTCDHPRDGRDPAGAGRSDEDHRGDRGLRRDEPVRLARLAPPRRRVSARSAACKLPTLRRVISAGAPVPARVLETFATMLAPGVQIFTPYGATEALPVASIGSDEILGETRHATDRGAGRLRRPAGRRDAGRDHPDHRRADRRLVRRPDRPRRRDRRDRRPGAGRHPRRTSTAPRRPRWPRSPTRHRAGGVLAPDGRPRLPRRAGPDLVLRAEVAPGRDRRRGRSSRSRARRSSTPIPRSPGRRSSASGRPARCGRCSASSREAWPRSRADRDRLRARAARARREPGRTRGRSRTFSSTGRSPSTSATTPRSSARSWPSGRRGGCRHERARHRRRRVPRRRDRPPAGRARRHGPEPRAGRLPGAPRPRRRAGPGRPGRSATPSPARSEGCDVVFHVAAKAGVWGPYADYYRSNVDGHAERRRGLPRARGAAARLHQLAERRLRRPRHGGGRRVGPLSRRTSTPPTRRPRPRPSGSSWRRTAPTLATVALRPHLIWGPGDNHLVPRIIARARAGRLRRIGRRAEAGRLDLHRQRRRRPPPRRRPARARARRSPGKAYFISQGEPLAGLGPGQPHPRRPRGLPPVTRTVPPGRRLPGRGRLRRRRTRARASRPSRR